jgi:hypothetical protein
MTQDADLVPINIRETGIRYGCQKRYSLVDCVARYQEIEGEPISKGYAQHTIDKMKRMPCFTNPFMHIFEGDKKSTYGFTLRQLENIVLVMPTEREHTERMAYARRFKKLHPETDLFYDTSNAASITIAQLTTESPPLQPVQAPVIPDIEMVNNSVVQAVSVTLIEDPVGVSSIVDIEKPDVVPRRNSISALINEPEMLDSVGLDRSKWDMFNGTTDSSSSVASSSADIEMFNGTTDIASSRASSSARPVQAPVIPDIEMVDTEINQTQMTQDADYGPVNLYGYGIGYAGHDLYSAVHVVAIYQQKEGESLDKDFAEYSINGFIDQKTVLINGMVHSPAPFKKGNKRVFDGDKKKTFALTLQQIEKLVLMIPSGKIPLDRLEYAKRFKRLHPKTDLFYYLDTSIASSITSSSSSKPSGASSSANIEMLDTDPSEMFNATTHGASNGAVVLACGLPIPSWIRVCDNLFHSRDIVIWGAGIKRKNVGRKMQDLAVQNSFVLNGPKGKFDDGCGRMKLVRAYNVTAVTKVMMLLDGDVAKAVQKLVNQVFL